LLHKLEQHPDGFKIGHINVGVIMVADDLAFVSQSRQGMQTLFDVAEHNASRRRYLFSETKTKLQVKNQTYQDGNIYLNNTR
jgi:hypothetical protein